jgi:hypothetical protein
MDPIPAFAGMTKKKWNNKKKRNNKKKWNNKKKGNNKRHIKGPIKGNKFREPERVNQRLKK